MATTTYLIPLRVSYDAHSHSIVLRLGSGRRPRAVVTRLHAEGIVEIDAHGRLASVTLIDNKHVHLGQRLVGLPTLPPDSTLPASDVIVYDLAGRMARFGLQATSSEVQRVSRTVQIDVDGQARLLAIHIPVQGSRRRDPDLSLALGNLV